MYKLRFCTSCNLYKEPVQVATCTSRLYKIGCRNCNLYRISPSNNSFYNTVVQAGFKKKFG